MSRAFRYNLILVLVAVGTALAAAAGWRFARASAPVSGPIVLVSIDSLRADHLPTYGYTKVATPALDALAADGVVFERAYTHVPLTLPAHVSLLSGRLPPETGVRDNIGTSVPGSVRLVQSMLADRGYATGGIVSSFALRKATGLSAGFAFFDDELVAAGPDAPVGAPGTSIAGGAAAGGRDVYGPPVVRRDGAESEKRAERWLSGAGTARAFLFLHLDEPHAPYAPPDRHAHFGPYDGEVAYADELLGRLVAYLKKQQLYDESTIIVVGDHGEALGAHGENGHGLLVLDDTLRVPLIIKRAGGEGGGTRVGELVQHVDIVPTILDLVNAPVPGGLHGRSLRTLLTGGSLGPRIAYAESLQPETQYGWPAARTVTDGRFRYVTAPVPALFDLEKDPGSRVDVSSAYPEDLARLAKALDSFSDTSPGSRVRGDGAPAAAEELAERHPNELTPGERAAALTLGFIGPRTFAGRFTDEPTGAPAPEAAPAIVNGYSQAMAAYGEKRWHAAIEHLRALARTSPDSADLWASLAQVADRAQRFDIAADAWRRTLAAATSGPAAIDTRLNLAWTLLRARRLDEAREQATVALDASPATAPRALELLARLAIARREPAAAHVHAQQLLELDPASPIPAWVEGRQLFERGRYDEALAQFEQAVTRAKDQTVYDLEFWLGETLLKLERASEAEEALVAELNRVPDHARAFTSLGTLYQAQMRVEELEALVTRFTRGNRTPDAYDTAARLWSALGRRDRADALRLESQQIFPLSPSGPPGLSTQAVTPGRPAHSTQQ